MESLPSVPNGLEDLYREVIMDHYRNPRNRRAIPKPSVVVEGYNPLCGDRVELQLEVVEGRVKEVAFRGQGCAISQASASMMTESLINKSLEEAEELVRAFRAFMTDQDVPPPANGYADLEVLEGVKKFPVRVKCATLVWNTLQEAIKTYRAGGKGSQITLKE